MSSNTTTQTLTINPVDSIPPGATVRHFDQLSERGREQFLSLVTNGTSTDDHPSSDLLESDVIVFTEDVSVTSS